MTHAEQREAKAAELDYQIAAHPSAEPERVARWQRSATLNRRIASALRDAEATGRRTVKVAGTLYAV